MSIYINNHRILTEEDKINPNLARGTSDEWKSYEFINSDNWDNTTVAKVSKSDLTTGKTYIFSADIDLSSDSNASYDLEIYPLPFNVQTDTRPAVSPGQVKRIYALFKVNDVNRNFDLHFRSKTQNVHTGKLKIRRVKLEEGTEMTAWTPASEDFAKQSDLNSLVSRIQALESKMGGYFTNLSAFLCNALYREVA